MVIRTASRKATTMHTRVRAGVGETKAEKRHTWITTVHTFSRALGRQAGRVLDPAAWPPTPLRLATGRRLDTAGRRPTRQCYVFMQRSTPWQTCLFQHQLGFSWKHFSHAAITRNDNSLTFPPPSIARYSSSVNWDFVERTKMPNLQHGSKGGFEPRLTWLRVRHFTAELPRQRHWNWRQSLPDLASL